MHSLAVTATVREGTQDSDLPAAGRRRLVLTRICHGQSDSGPVRSSRGLSRGQRQLNGLGMAQP